MNHFIYTHIISLLTGRYELNKLTSLPMCGFIAQLVEHRTGIAEVTGSNPVEALIFFRLFHSSCLKLENSLRGSFFTFSDNDVDSESEELVSGKPIIARSGRQVNVWTRFDL